MQHHPAKGRDALISLHVRHKSFEITSELILWHNIGTGEAVLRQRLTIEQHIGWSKCICSYASNAEKMSRKPDKAPKGQQLKQHYFIVMLVLKMMLYLDARVDEACSAIRASTTFPLGCSLAPVGWGTPWQRAINMACQSGCLSLTGSKGHQMSMFPYSPIHQWIE